MGCKLSSEVFLWSFNIFLWYDVYFVFIYFWCTVSSFIGTTACSFTVMLTEVKTCQNIFNQCHSWWKQSIKTLANIWSFQADGGHLWDQESAFEHATVCWVADKKITIWLFRQSDNNQYFYDNNVSNDNVKTMWQCEKRIIKLVSALQSFIASFTSLFSCRANFTVLVHSQSYHRVAFGCSRQLFSEKRF